MIWYLLGHSKQRAITVEVIPPKWLIKCFLWLGITIGWLWRNHSLYAYVNFDDMPSVCDLYVWPYARVYENVWLCPILQIMYPYSGYWRVFRKVFCSFVVRQVCISTFTEMMGERGQFSLKADCNTSSHWKRKPNEFSLAALCYTQKMLKTHIFILYSEIIKINAT